MAGIEDFPFFSGDLLRKIAGQDPKDPGPPRGYKPAKLDMGQLAQDAADRARPELAKKKKKPAASSPATKSITDQMVPATP